MTSATLATGPPSMATDINSKEQVVDLCVVGSGPAGIIMALEYARENPDKKVLLAEYGAQQGTGQNQLDDSIKNHNPANHHDPYECTNKGLGGTSATWGGRCVMYDEVDFSDRPILQGECTWGGDSLDAVTRIMIKRIIQPDRCIQQILSFNR